jgi:hypothetical protein
VTLETFSIRNKEDGRRREYPLSAVPSAAGDSGGGGEMVDSVNKICKLTPYLACDFPSDPIVFFILKKCSLFPKKMFFIFHKSLLTEVSMSLEIKQ